MTDAEFRQEVVESLTDSVCHYRHEIARYIDDPPPWDVNKAVRHDRNTWILASLQDMAGQLGIEIDCDAWDGDIQ